MSGAARRLVLAEPQASAPAARPLPAYDPFAAVACYGARTEAEALAGVRVVRGRTRSGVTITSRIYGEHEARVRAAHATHQHAQMEHNAEPAKPLAAA